MGFDGALTISQGLGNVLELQLINIPQGKDLPLLSGHLSGQLMELMPEFLLNEIVQGAVGVPGCFDILNWCSCPEKRPQSFFPMKIPYPV